MAWDIVLVCIDLALSLVVKGGGGRGRDGRRTGRMGKFERAEGEEGKGWTMSGSKKWMEGLAHCCRLPMNFFHVKALSPSLGVA